MATNDRSLRPVIPALLFFLFLPPLLTAQVSSPSASEIRLVQRLAWSGGENAFNYEVIIEKEENGTYSRVMQGYTKMSFFDVALSPGNYRFRVIPYDYLEQPGRESEWMNIEVRSAVRPMLDDTPPELVYSDSVYVLNISGNSFEPDVEIYLRRSDGESVAPIELVVYEGGNGASLVFAEEDLVPGDYELVIRNPGGLETRRSGISIASPGTKPAPSPQPETESQPEPEPEKPPRERHFNINPGLAWMPLLPIYGESFGNEPIVLPGAALRFGAFTFDSNPLAIAAGVELTACWYNSGDPTAQNMITADLNLAARKNLPNQAISLCFRVGAGYKLLLGDEKQESPLENIYTNIGVSFQLLIVKELYLESGIDHIHLFAKTPSGAFRPWIGAGWQF